MIGQYFEKVRELLEVVEEQESSAMEQAAKKIATSIQHGGIIHLFGCGHSHILVEEVYYRAGGLVPIQPIIHEPLMLHKGAAALSALEQTDDYAHTFMGKQQIKKGDIVFVISTSGRNPVPVDVAYTARSEGAYVIGITSPKYSNSQPSRHRSGAYLYDAVDLVIDNHTVVGDSLLAHEQVSVPFGPSSTVVGTTIINAIFAESIAIMAEGGYSPPVFLSGNIEGSTAHNEQLVKAYSDRIKL